MFISFLITKKGIKLALIEGNFMISIAISKKKLEKSVHKILINLVINKIKFSQMKKVIII